MGLHRLDNDRHQVSTLITAATNIFQGTLCIDGECRGADCIEDADCIPDRPICGTDSHLIAGDYPGFWPPEFPIIPGHEWSGEIVALGPGAEKAGWQVGDRVAGTNHDACGVCQQCVEGRYNLCERLPATTFQADLTSFIGGDPTARLSQGGFRLWIALCEDALAGACSQDIAPQCIEFHFGNLYQVIPPVQ